MSKTLHQWHDTTTYSRHQPDIEPNCWSYITGKFTISVIKSPRHIPGKWCIQCLELNINFLQLNSPIDSPIEIIQSAAIRIIKTKISDMLKSFDNANT